MALISNFSDIRGAGRLTIDAVNGITDLVENLHQTISSGGGLLGASGRERTSGITGLVYRNIRTVSGLVGGGIDVVLGRLALLLEEKSSTPGRDAVLAALNGVLGDHLAVSDNPLAISMQLCRNGAPLATDDGAFTEALVCIRRQACPDGAWLVFKQSAMEPAGA